MKRIILILGFLLLSSVVIAEDKEINKEYISLIEKLDENLKIYSQNTIEQNYYLYKGKSLKKKCSIFLCGGKGWFIFIYLPSLDKDNIELIRPSFDAGILGKTEHSHINGYVRLNCKKDEKCIYTRSLWGSYEDFFYDVNINLHAPIPGIDVSLEDKGKYHEHIDPILVLFKDIFVQLITECSENNIK